MLKLEKGQNITKTAEETAVELDGEMYMDAKLISNFITQQAAVAMAERTKHYENNIKKLEKGGRDRVSGESTTKNGTRGGGRASKKKKYPRLKRPPSQDHLRNLRLDHHKAERVSSEAHQEEDPNKQALPTAVRPKKGQRKK